MYVLYCVTDYRLLSGIWPSSVGKMKMLLYIWHHILCMRISISIYSMPHIIIFYISFAPCSTIKNRQSHRATNKHIFAGNVNALQPISFVGFILKSIYSHSRVSGVQCVSSLVYFVEWSMSYDYFYFNTANSLRLPIISISLIENRVESVFQCSFGI